MDEFKAGDIVELKSGSPRMTIAFLSKEGYCYCTWYDPNSFTWNEQVKIYTVLLKKISE